MLSYSSFPFQNINSAQCELYKPDTVFNRFQVVEFPISFVGLSTTQLLDVEINLNNSAFLKTMCNGKLLKFEEAREESAAHRAFKMATVNEHTIAITFEPSTESISKLRSTKQCDNRFVFDLRLIKIDGTICCENELHAEIGRYYICGEFEYCKISHYPNVIHFGEVEVNSKVSRKIRFQNKSSLVAAKIEYNKVTSIVVTPEKFTIPPNSAVKIIITIKPTCLKVCNTLSFSIMNPHKTIDLPGNPVDNNYITYTIKCTLNAKFSIKPKILNIKSLHILNEKSPIYTYLGPELDIHNKRKAIADNYLEISKQTHQQKPVVENFCSGNDRCHLEILGPPRKNPKFFCKTIRERLTTYGLTDISLIPFNIDFGRVALNTYGKNELTIKNKSKYDININFLKDECIMYTKKHLRYAALKLKSFSEMTITIFCLGFVEGNHKKTFEYIIDKKYFRQHPYFLQVGNPTLLVMEKSLKFGMVTTESFVTSVPVRIHNFFNVPVDFGWDELSSDVPFEIVPRTGSVPDHSCKICDVVYNFKASKTKTHEVDFISISKVRKVIPIELSVITRKISIKFLQPAVTFKDVALNIETIERVKLENSSREIAVFHIMEPLIPGLTIEPMAGTIRPKTIMVFEIIMKVACVLEFAFDIYLRINNKENLILPVSGNVVEPKLIIHPKLIYMARIPCHMITYVPVTFQNVSTLTTMVEVLDTGDDNIFKLYTANGNDKQIIFEFYVEGGQTKTMYIKVNDIFRREYDMFMPFKINGLLGPPDNNAGSTELQYYIGQYEQQYENNPKVKLKTINKDISFCRVTGVITVPWIEFSEENFEIEYSSAQDNKIEFTMKNISKYYLYVTIITAKLAPNFTLKLITEESQCTVNDSNIKFEFDRKKEAGFRLKFHPKSHGKFISTAILFLDKHMTIPYNNLTFIGTRQTPSMKPSMYHIIFPPCRVGKTLTHNLYLTVEIESDMSLFSCMSREEPNILVKFLNAELIPMHGIYHTRVQVEISVCCQTTYAKHLTLIFNHECGSCCEVETSFVFTHCPLTLHTELLVDQHNNPYPYFPLKQQQRLYDYLENCSNFLEKWMFQQGFRRDLYPVIPDTFHAISSSLCSQQSGGKSKGINVSYLNFVRRIAGPLMKHVRKITVHGIEEPFKSVQEIHDTYREVINLIRNRGANLWILQAKFLLSYDQFVIYSENITPKRNADIILTRELVENISLFDRLNKQCWIDFILQSYKVFVMDSCFFECVCMTTMPRDVIKVLMDWYNEQIASQYNKFKNKDKPIKNITNLTTDLIDGSAVAAAIMNYCPFMSEHFKYFYTIDENSTEGDIINNACLIIEALNLLRLYFPLSSKDFLEPIFLQMLFFSIHLYVTLPMFKPKDNIVFSPPLLRSSTRQVAIAPTSQEALIFNYMLLNSNPHNFLVEKVPSVENGKRMYISIKYTANFVIEETCVLLVHGYNKTRIFDTYIIFLLKGNVGSLNPVKKSKVTGPLYRPVKVDVLVSSPFSSPATFRVSLTDDEPVIPVIFDENPATSKRCRFYVMRLNLLDKEITLTGLPKESGQEVIEHKLYLQMISLSTQISNTWIWFRGECGEFFIRVTSQPRWDLAIDTLQAKVNSWPMDPCSCGESCECYRTTVLMIPHRNELMIKSLRYALLEHASSVMMQVFDKLIETATGKIILGMLLAEGGTNMSDVKHILRSEAMYRITSRTLDSRLDQVKLAQHTSAMLPLLVTLPIHDKAEKYSVTLTSECGMDIRTYKVIFIETPQNTMRGCQ